MQKSNVLREADPCNIFRLTTQEKPISFFQNINILSRSDAVQREAFDFKKQKQKTRTTFFRC